MALPLALFTLVVIGALVAAAFASAHLEQRIGQNALYAVQAAGAAEVGTAAVVGGWEARGLSLLAPGESRVLSGETLPGRSGYTPTVRRLNGQLFLVQVDGVRTDADMRPLARRRLRLLLRSADSALEGVAPVRPLSSRAWTPVPP